MLEERRKVFLKDFENYKPIQEIEMTDFGSCDEGFEILFDDRLTYKDYYILTKEYSNVLYNILINEIKVFFQQ